MTEEQYNQATAKKAAMGQIGNALLLVTETPEEVNTDDMLGLIQSLQQGVYTDDRIKDAINAANLTYYNAIKDGLTTLNGTIQDEFELIGVMS